MEADNKIIEKNNPSERYVAFCDILGFSEKILNDFDETLLIYEAFADFIAAHPLAKGTEVTIYSDAILITGEALDYVLSAVQILWFVAQIHSFMIRGAVAKGRYWEKKQGHNLFVASDALVRAVKLEQSVKIPAVVIADDIEIPDNYWMHRFTNGVLDTPVLHFRDRNIVNPFAPMWFRSAKGRALGLMKKSPKHKDKYLWFLALHESIGNQNLLVPPVVWERLHKQYNIDLNAFHKLPGYDGAE